MKKTISKILNLISQILSNIICRTESLDFRINPPERNNAKPSIKTPEIYSPVFYFVDNMETWLTKIKPCERRSFIIEFDNISDCYFSYAVVKHKEENKARINCACWAHDLPCLINKTNQSIDLPDPFERPLEGVPLKRIHRKIEK